MATKLVCWNIGKRRKPWKQLVKMDADVALLQEAGKVPNGVADRVQTGSAEHGTHTYGIRVGMRVDSKDYTTASLWS